ncbi:MAG: enoyl-CoA hydratase [Proteobacteria bacterium]|nr:enoyl-CoA hydratase [Pseudomonadota bacterium]
MTSSYTSIRYETTDTGIARITLAVPEKRNAQTFELLVELNDALTAASHDDAVKVIILAADDPDFSSGHSGPGNLNLKEYKPSGTWAGFSAKGAEGQWGFEQEFFFGFCWRWRNIPKPTMVEVQGWVIAGGLMLVWPFDIVVASEDAKFTDPVVALGVNGVEYFAHPWEFGIRKAKELLFTGDAITAQEAKELGMVNHVVPKAELTSFTMEMAERIAKRPMMALKLAKQSVNQAQEAQGFYTALQSAMNLQQLGHSHWRSINDNGAPVNLEGGALVKESIARYKKKKPEAQ